MLASVLRELEIRAVEERARQAEEERRQAERQARWERAMKEARTAATRAYHAERLREQAARWRETCELREYCAALEQRIANADTPEAPDLAGARDWLEWARAHLDSLDPLQRLPKKPPPPEFNADDLKPYLPKGWSPHGPDAHSSGWRPRWPTS
ncbi:hypothetical protein [Streptomyces sp. GS7]|uniref:hypothetical protein n=1 Tax=Streptomyces sp. GS7 TaxID=2692234 RepID=UPI001316F097|nr:hypothetical protein [Streptomyces sp. GS7]QHC23357.1 hypothetical protein GR130_20135 [Streptomyces sp. GS7]